VLAGDYIMLIPKHGCLVEVSKTGNIRCVGRSIPCQACGHEKESHTCPDNHIGQLKLSCFKEG